MQLIYVGPHDGAEIDLPDGRSITAERHGDPITVDAALGERLLEQPGNWRRAKKPSTPKKEK